MLNLLYKEWNIFKENIKKSIIFVVFLFVINVFYYKIGIKGDLLSFIMAIIASLQIMVAVVVESINIEKNNKMFEKMLTLYKIDEIIKAKILLSVIMSSVVGILFSVGNNIILMYLDNNLFNVKLFGIEILMIIAISWFASNTMALLYLIVKNSSVANIILIPIVMAAMVLNTLLSVLSIGIILLIIISLFLIGKILFKIIGNINVDLLI